MFNLHLSRRSVAETEPPTSDGPGSVPMGSWPTVVTALLSWDDLYVLPRNNLLDNGDVLPTAAEAVAWANELIRRIEVGV